MLPFVRFWLLVACVYAGMAIAPAYAQRAASKPKGPGASALRSTLGQPIAPTVPSPLQPTPTNRRLSFAGISVEATSVIPVNPGIPNASPLSTTRNTPGAFATDPLNAVPLLQNVE